jgi:hypothetical protein
VLFAVTAGDSPMPSDDERNSHKQYTQHQLHSKGCSFRRCHTDAGRRERRTSASAEKRWRMRCDQFLTTVHSESRTTPSAWFCKSHVMRKHGEQKTSTCDFSWRESNSRKFTGNLRRR